MTTTEVHPPVGYIELVRRNRNFRFLWFGQIISLLGDWFNLIASASLIATLSESGLAIGGLFSVQMLAPFLVSPLAGVVADRYNRKHILIVTDIIRAITVACFLLVRNPEDLWLLYTLAMIQFSMTGFFFPARTAILPDIVEPHELGVANALTSATWSVMLALGAAVGGFVAGMWGVYTAYVIDAITFLASALLIAQISLQVTPAAEDAARGVRAVLRLYIDGLKYLARHADVLVTALHKGVVALLAWSTFGVIQVSIAENIFPIGEGGGISLGLMYAITGVGTGIGPIIARHFTGDRDRPLRLAIFVGYLCIAAGYSLVAPLLSFEMVLLGGLFRGIGGGMIWVFSTQLLLYMVPADVRGRVFSSEHAIFTLTGAIGAAVVGTALDSPLGISGVIWGLAGLILVPACLWLIWVSQGAVPVSVSPDPTEHDTP